MMLLWLASADLRCGSALRVAGSPTVNRVAFQPAREKRRHAVEVSRHHDLGFAERGVDISPVPFDGLFEDFVAGAPEQRREPPHRIAFAAGCRIDIYEPASDGNDVR